MATFLSDFTKSAVQANANDIRPLRIPTNHNFKGNNTKKQSRQSWRRSTSSINCCQYTANEKQLQRGMMYRRQLLLASTSLPLKPQQMIASTTSPPTLSSYHKLANAVKEAEKLKKTSHGSAEINDVVCWRSSSEISKTPNAYWSSDELSTMITVSPSQELFHQVNGKEVVTARVRRSATLKLMKNKEEQLVLQGIEVTNDKPLCFHVYIILGQEKGGDEEELYAGTFCHMPPRFNQGGSHNNKQDFQQRKARRCCLTLGLNDMLSHWPENVIVKLVPTFKLADDPIKVSSIFIDYT